MLSGKRRRGKSPSGSLTRNARFLGINARVGKVRKPPRKNVGKLPLIVLYYFGLWRYYLFG